MKLSIYEVYVPIEDQPQADRMKQICIDYGLPIFDDFRFYTESNKKPYAFFYYFAGEFCNYLENTFDYQEVTESEFLELVKINFANSK